jgi:transposase InsO family protein
VAGWQRSCSLRTDLALDALEMGLWTRRRADRNIWGLEHHSDKDLQYVAGRYAKRASPMPAAHQLDRADADVHERGCTSTDGSVWRESPGYRRKFTASSLAGRARLSRIEQWDTLWSKLLKRRLVNAHGTPSADDPEDVE